MRTMDNIFISFIMPAFNAMTTIKRSLDSIYRLPIEQNEFEVIIIDDCSTDNTVALVEEYGCNHTNLILLRQRVNHRQGSARNKGMAIARGRYIVFVDSDDETDKGVVEAVQMAEDGGLDMVAMRYVKVDDNDNIGEKGELLYDSHRLFSGIEMQTQHPFWGTAPWPYIFRKSFVDEVGYPFAEDVLFEDSDFVNVHLYHAKRMAYCDECGYRVYYNPNSTTHTMSYKHLSDYALLGVRMLKFYESIEDKSTQYAYSILEGGSFNIKEAFKKLFKLQSVAEVRSFYDRFDARYDRMRLLHYRKPAYCWTRWTRFVLKHPKFAIMVIGVGVYFLRIRNN